MKLPFTFRNLKEISEHRIVLAGIVAAILLIAVLGHFLKFGPSDGKYGEVQIEATDNP